MTDVATLRAENDVLRERIATLESALSSSAPLPVAWRLTASEDCVFRVLLNRELATKEAIMAALYRFDRDDEPYAKIADVFICKLRKKLIPFGIRIETLHGRGWALSRSDRERFRDLLREAA